MQHKLNGKNSSVNRIVIIDEDPFSRNWLSQLLMRDWRTQVVMEATSISNFNIVKNRKELGNIDGIIINLDSSQISPNCIKKLFVSISNTIKIVLVSTCFETDYLDFINSENLGGYLLKSEVEISIAWAMVKAIQGYFVISKTIKNHLRRMRIIVDKKSLVLDGIEALEFLTKSENRNARLALVYSMSRGNLADELLITSNSSWTLVSNLYKSMGINDLLDGDDWINFNLNEEPVIENHIINHGDNRLRFDSAATKETFAYHVYTKPRMYKIGCEEEKIG